MEIAESDTRGEGESLAVARAWKANIDAHLPHDRLVLLAIASLTDEGHVPETGRQAFVSELAGMTRLDEWKVAEILRVLLRDGHLCTCGCILEVV